MIGWHFLSTLALLFLAASVSSAKGEELVDVGVAVAPQGGLGRFSVGFYSNSIIPLTAAVQVEISYDSKNSPIPPNAEGTPDCTSNPAAGKSDTTFAFVPDGCSGTGCTSVRATVESLTDSSPIPQVPEGVELAAATDGSYPLPDAGKLAEATYFTQAEADAPPSLSEIKNQNPINPATAVTEE